MSRESTDRRDQVAESIESMMDSVATEVTEEFLRRHPDWLERFGDRAHTYGVEDACFHMKFLAGSIAAGDPALFGDYARWTAGVLAKRGIAPTFFAENLKQIGTVLSERTRPSDAELIARYITVGIEAAHGPEAGIRDVDGEDSALALTRNLFAQAILRGERTGALNIVNEALEDGASVVDIYTDVLQEALYHVGRLWETNEISVAQEHMATAIVQFVIARLYPRLDFQQSSRGNMVLTGIRGEYHQVGGMMLADVLEADGWNVRFLGTDMPHDGIVHAVEEHRPAVLGITATMLFSVPRVRELVEACRALPGQESLRIVVGGGAFRAAPHLYKEIGADGFAENIRDARELLRKSSNGVR